MKLLFTLLFIVVGFNALQSQPVDSVDKVYIRKCYSSVILALRSAQWDDAISYADTIFTVSKKGAYDQGVAIGLALKGEAYLRKGDLSMAYQCFNDNLRFMDSCQYKGDVKGRLYKNLFILFSIQQNQDSIQKYSDIIFNLPCEKSTIIAKDYVAKQLSDSNKPKEALAYATKNLSCARELDEKSMIVGVLSFMGNIYQSIEDYETAILYVDSTLQIAKELNDTLYICLAYDQLGIINTRVKKYSKALEWIKKGVKLAEQIYTENGVYTHSKLTRSPVPIGALYTHLAAAYQNLDNQSSISYIDSAKFYHQKALYLHYKKNNRWDIALQLVNLAKCTVASGENYETALDSLQRAYRVAPRHVNWKLMQYHIYSTKGETYTKLEQFDKASVYLDSAEVVAHTLKDTANRLMGVYELQKNLYLAKKDYKKAYNYEMNATALYKKLQELKQEKVLTNFEIKYETEQVKQQNIVLAKERDIQQLKAERNQQLIYAAVVLLVLIVIIFILLIFQFRTKAFYLTQKLKYQLLRNQMNPHFIFNSLTAIQSFVYKKNPIEAGEYIGSFAELMRAILDNSHEEYVSLNKEIQWLENYLKLQLLRFGNQFDYTLNLDPNIDVSDTLIPPMLTQPFIENALEHGLKDIDYKGHLDININVNNNLLQIDILDNGIGLEESKKNNQDKKHESRATQITQERLDFLNKKQQKNINLRIQSNKEKGTKVSFAIPFVSKF